jgi:hypothetical protein
LNSTFDQAPVDERNGSDWAQQDDDRESLSSPVNDVLHPFKVTLPQNINEHLNDDDRGKWEWESRWKPEAIKEIYIDAGYIGFIFLTTLIAILLIWRGTMFEIVSNGCASCVRSRFDQFGYFFVGGMLGGTLFAIKYLYKVVARGRWHLDRRLWRIFSPFISGGLALAIGTLIDSGIFGLAVKNPSASSYLSLGFIAGYFADNALAKMQEIAETIFGKPQQQKPSQTQLHRQSSEK